MAPNVLWIAATRPGVASALQVSVDGAAPVPVQAGSSLGMWGPSNVFSWMPSARVGLKAGKHAVSMDGCLTLYVNLHHATGTAWLDDVELTAQ